MEQAGLPDQNRSGGKNLIRASGIAVPGADAPSPSFDTAPGTSPIPNSMDQKAGDPAGCGNAGQSTVARDRNQIVAASGQTHPGAGSRNYPLFSAIDSMSGTFGLTSQTLHLAWVIAAAGGHEYFPSQRSPRSLAVPNGVQPQARHGFHSVQNGSIFAMTEMGYAQFRRLTSQVRTGSRGSSSPPSHFALPVLILAQGFAVVSPLLPFTDAPQLDR